MRHDARWRPVARDANSGNAGDYLAPPAVAELMYGAATRARTAASRIVIAPAP